MVRRKSNKPLWPLLLMIGLIGLGAGAAAAWLTGLHVRGSGKEGGQVLSELRMPDLHVPANPFAARETAGPDPAALARMDRKQLESELRRLSELVYSKDQRIAELTIQLKLMTEGSHTADASPSPR